MENEKSMTPEETQKQEMGEGSLTARKLFSKGEAGIGKALLLMKGKYGGAFYVKFLQDIGSKEGWLQLIIRYPDEQKKTVLLCKNVFAEGDLESSCLGSVEVGRGEEKKIITPLLNTSLEYGNYRMLERYETPQMPIPAKSLWKLILDNYNKIPTTVIYQTEDIEGMYWELYRIAHEAANSNNFSTTYRENDVRFLVTKEEMETVANENGLTLSQLRMEFNLMGLLVKDKGSVAESGKCYNSYQLTKKVDGGNKRYYALKKSVKSAENQIDESCAVEYSDELSKSPLEQELEQTKARIAKLENTVREKDAEIRKIILERVDDVTQEELMKIL